MRAWRLKQIEEITGIPLPTLHRHIKEGKLNSVKPVGTRFVPHSDLVTYLGYDPTEEKDVEVSTTRTQPRAKNSNEQKSQMPLFDRE